MQVGGHPEVDEALQNWMRLQEYELEYPHEEDRKIYQYLKTFFNQMSAPPDFTLVRDYFEKQDEVEVCTRLEELKKAQPYIRTNFLSVVRSEQEQQQVKSFILAARDASAIAEHGRNLEKPINGKKVLKGVNDAINFIYEKMSDFSRVESGEKLEGIVTEDAEEFLEEYDKGKLTSKFAGRNIIGLEPVDAVCKGHRSGEFWVHCAAPGELKTTLALNYAYNNAYLFGRNIFYGIFEMPYKQLRRQLFVVHSSHGKFVTDWYEQDRRRGLPPDQCYVGLDYQKVRDYELDELGEQRLKIVAQDFKATCPGRLYIWRPASAITGTPVEDVYRRAEMFHNKWGCDGIVLDHMGWLRSKVRTTSTVDAVNNVVSECRMMALSFARGRTVPVFGLYQINRQGKVKADKEDGRYGFEAISYANRIEQDADVITYTYLNPQLRKDGKFYLGCMKNRDNAIFDRMIGKIIWQSKRMRHIESGLLDKNTDQALLRATTLTMDDMLMTGS
jgi:replicative DNA helicase